MKEVVEKVGVEKEVEEVEVEEAVIGGGPPPGWPLPTSRWLGMCSLAGVGRYWRGTGASAGPGTDNFSGSDFVATVERRPALSAGRRSDQGEASSASRVPRLEMESLEAEADDGMEKEKDPEDAEVQRRS